MSKSSQVKTVIDQLLTDEHEDLRNSVMAAYLENNRRGSDLIIALVPSKESHSIKRKGLLASMRWTKTSWILNCRQRC